MDPERWREIEQIFNAAVELPPKEVDRFLSDACGEDSQLREEVEALLTKATGRDTLFTTAVVAAADAVSSAHDRILARERIGCYRITGLIGRGGMAEVFSAVRDDDQFEKRVAIKLIRYGLASEFMLQRFRTERQILASLDHPNIARLLDGGVTDDGLPYFIMEYIEGLPITQYCKVNHLSIRQRLGLMRLVCSAVHCAHRNLVIHRDLKPANILVTGDGQPKLLDFGIAKLLDDGSTLAAGNETATGIRLLTPDYASPEQILGERITTASDIYSLGIVLYEMLTGSRPNKFEDRSMPAIERAIRNVEPRKPSSIAAAAGGRRARRDLAGDLDNIVLMAMRREPERRYQSADQLSEDIRRYLLRRPVRARPDTLAYRTGKFIRRHRAAVGLALVTVMALAAIAVTMTIQATRVARERDRATQVTEFLIKVFEVARPGNAPDGQITARDLLDEGARRIEQELKGQPEVQAAMMDTIGHVYNNLGLHDEAQSLIEQGLNIRRGVLGEEHVDVATSMDNLGGVFKDKGDYDRAESLMRESLRIRRKLLGRGHADVASSLHNLAGVLQAKGRYDSAEPLYREALEMRRKLFGNHHSQVALSLNSLGYLLKVKGDFDAAEPLYREALEMRRSLLGNEHPDVATSLNNLARLLSDRGNNRAAEPLMREAVELDRKSLGDEHPDLATSMTNLALILRDLGKHDESESLLRSALAIRRKALGDEHPSVATSIYSLGMLMLDKRAHDEAERLFREALDLWRRSLPAKHPNISHALLGLGRVLTEKGQAQQAEPLLREALEIRTSALPAGHIQIATVRGALGDCLIALRRYEEAESQLLESFKVFDQKEPAQDRRKAVARLVKLYQAWNRPEDAARYKSQL
jgi:serine/threonine-protein kinase